MFAEYVILFLPHWGTGNAGYRLHVVGGEHLHQTAWPKGKPTSGRAKNAGGFNMILAAFIRAALSSDSYSRRLGTTSMRFFTFSAHSMLRLFIGVEIDRYPCCIFSSQQRQWCHHRFLHHRALLTGKFHSFPDLLNESISFSFSKEGSGSAQRDSVKNSNCRSARSGTKAESR